MFADVRRLHRMRQKLDMMSCAVPNSSDEHLDFWIPYNDANLPDTSGGAQCTKAGDINYWTVTITPSKPFPGAPTLAGDYVVPTNGAHATHVSTK